MKRHRVLLQRVSTEITKDEDAEKVTRRPLEREVFAEVVWQ